MPRYRVPSPSDAGSYDHLYDEGTLSSVRHKYAQIAAAAAGGGGGADGAPPKRQRTE